MALRLSKLNWLSTCTRLEQTAGVFVVGCHEIHVGCREIYVPEFQTSNLQKSAFDFSNMLPVVIIASMEDAVHLASSGSGVVNWRDGGGRGGN